VLQLGPASPTAGSDDALSLTDTPQPLCSDDVGDVRGRAGRGGVLVGVFALLVSFAGSWVPSYWSDEAATVRAASLAPGALLAFVRHKDAVHAAYYLTVGLWSRVAGSSELAMRLPSALAVGATAWLLVVLLRRFGAGHVGVIAGLVFAVLPRTTYMGAEARSYAIATLLVVVVVLRGVIAVQDERRRDLGTGRALARDLVWFGLACAVATAVFVYAALVVVTVLVWAVVGVVRHRHRARPVVWLVVSGLLGIACTAPLLIIVAGQKGQIAWLGSQDTLNVWTLLAEPWAESSGAIAGLGAVAVIAGVVVVHRVVARRGAALVVLVVLWMLLPGALLLVANAVAGPLYTSRYLAFCTPAVAIGFALVVDAVGARAVRSRPVESGASCVGRSWWVGVGSVVLIAAVAAPTIVLQRTPEAKGGADLRQIADVVHTKAGAGDAIVFERARTVALDPRQAIAAYPRDFSGLDDIAVTERFPATGTFSDRTVPLAGRRARLLRVHDVWYVAPAASGCSGSADARVLRGVGFTVARTWTPGRDEVCEYARS
jgi:mannosyltransferase